MGWSLAEITPTRELVTRACPTALRHALTMCLPLQVILRAHQGSIHHQVVPKHAPKTDTRRPTAMTNTWPQSLILSVVCRRSNKISCRTVPCMSPSLSTVISQLTSLECTHIRLDPVWEVTLSLW